MPAVRSGRRRCRSWWRARTRPARSPSLRTWRARPAASTRVALPSRRPEPTLGGPVTVTETPAADPGDPGNGAALCQVLGVDVDDELMELALTHRSYAYEHGGLPTNERLEFLGDSVLGVVVTERLYREHPELPEGQLA